MVRSSFCTRGATFLGCYTEGMPKAVLLVDHGSRRASAHQQFIELGERLQTHLTRSGVPMIVEIAHMEIAEPSIAQGLGRCVERGASDVTVLPCFLSRGRHVVEDIPALVREAVVEHPTLEWRIAPPLVELDGFVPLLASGLS